MSSPRLHVELLDYVVDFLHDTIVALRSCSLISKSWVPHARRQLFAQIKFRNNTRDLQSWKSTFPDPSTSPGYYAKTLSIGSLKEVVATDAEEGGWIRAFDRIVKLDLEDHWQPESTASLVPLRGLFPALRSVSISISTVAPSQISSFIYSFPLLEDISLTLDYSWTGYESDDESDDEPTAVRSPTPPPFTGALKLYAEYGIFAITNRLFSLSADPCFRKLRLALNAEEDSPSATKLIRHCSSTLEILKLDCFPNCTSICRASQHELNVFVDAPPVVSSIDLSNATKLKEVVVVAHLFPEWITASLQTITRNHRDLQKITIDISFPLFILDPEHNLDEMVWPINKEIVCQGWLEFDHVLSELQESHTIQLKVRYDRPDRMDTTRARNFARELLPEVTTIGRVHTFERVYEWWV